MPDIAATGITNGNDNKTPKTSAADVFEPAAASSGGSGVKVQQIASMFSSMQQQQRQQLTSTSRSSNFRRSTIASLSHDEESSSSPTRRQTNFHANSTTTTAPSSTATANRSRYANQARSRSTDARPSTVSSTTAAEDLHFLDHKEKFTTAKALFENLERASREQTRGSARFSNANSSTPRTPRAQRTASTSPNRAGSSCYAGGAGRGQRSPFATPTIVSQSSVIVTVVETTHRHENLNSVENKVQTPRGLPKNVHSPHMRSPPPPIPPKPRNLTSPTAESPVGRKFLFDQEQLPASGNRNSLDRATRELNDLVSSLQQMTDTCSSVKLTDDGVATAECSSSSFNGGMERMVPKSRLVQKLPQKQSSANDVELNKADLHKTSVGGRDESDRASVKSVNLIAKTPIDGSGNSTSASNKFSTEPSTSSNNVDNDGNVVTVTTTVSSTVYEPYWRQPNYHHTRRTVTSDTCSSAKLGDTTSTTSSEIVVALSTSRDAEPPVVHLRKPQSGTTPTGEQLTAMRDEDSKDSGIGSEGGTATTATLGDTSSTAKQRSSKDDKSSAADDVLVVELGIHNTVTTTTNGTVEYMTQEEANKLLSPATREVLRPKKSSPETEVKALPSHLAIPPDVNKRLSVCSIDSSTNEQHGISTNERYSIVDDNDVHWIADDQFYIEIEGISEDDQIATSSTVSNSDEVFDYKKPSRVKFSSRRIRVYSTYSGIEYDRRNEDIDPVAASAEYELERRLEKMDVFEIEVDKGMDGLGFSIIGMGVGADAGLEKLGIFVKSITPGGAVFRDGRIHVCDQIVEVDRKSLVGVSQTYAATVLRSTSGLVRFKIGRERDLDTSEIAQLIRQSLEQDQASIAREQEKLAKRLNMPADMNSVASPPPSASKSSPVVNNGTTAAKPADNNWLAAGGSSTPHRTPLPSSDSVFEDESANAAPALNDNRRIQELINQLKQQDNVAATVEDQAIQQQRPNHVITNDALMSPTRRQLFQQQHQQLFQHPVTSSNASFNSSTNGSSSAYGTPPVEKTAFHVTPTSPDDVTDSSFQTANAEMNRILYADDEDGLDEKILAQSHRLLDTSLDSNNGVMRRGVVQSNSLDSLDDDEHALVQKIGNLETTLNDVKQEAGKYQNLLTESQDHYDDLDKRYKSAKKRIKDYQERERELLEREEAHLKQLREKDNQYAMLVRQLNDKVAELEKQLTDAQRKRASLAESASLSSMNTAVSSAAGFNGSSAVIAGGGHLLAPPHPPAATSATDMSPALAYLPAKKPNHVAQRIIDDQKPSTSGLNDPYIAMISIGSEADLKYVDDLSHDFGVPYTQLLDSTAAKSKAEAVRQSVIMSARSLPSRHAEAEVYVMCHHTMEHAEILKNQPSHLITEDLELAMRGGDDFDRIPEVLEWTTEDVFKFLHSLGLSKYEPEFKINRIDGCKLLQLDGAKLKSMGVSNHNDRALIKKRVKEMKVLIEKERKKENKKLFQKLDKDRKVSKH